MMVAVEKLNIQETTLEYQEKVEEEIAENGDMDEDDVKGMWYIFKESIMKMAEDMCRGLVR